MRARDICRPGYPVSGHVARLLYYFAALGPGVVASADDILMLLYRGDAEGGPDTARKVIGSQIYNARAWLRPEWSISADRPPGAHHGGPSLGWRLSQVGDCPAPGDGVSNQGALGIESSGD